MEYNFSVTRRLFAIFILSSCMFVACVFLLGFEFGKKMNDKSKDGLAILKGDITQKIEQEAQAVSALKGTLASSSATADKK